MIRQLWRDGLVYAAGTILSRGLGLLLLPLYARTLDPAGFGLLDLIVTTGVLANLIVPMETPQAVARFWNDCKTDEARRRLAGTALCFALVGYGLFALIGMLAAGPLARTLMGGGEQAQALRAGALFIAFNGLMLMLQAQFRWELRPRAFAAASIAYGLLTLGGLAALAASGSATVTHVLAMQALASALVAAACLGGLRGRFAWRVDAVELRRLLRYSLPLVPAGVAVFATVYLHRFVLGAQATIDEVGLFAMASRVAALATLVLIGVQSALTPLIYAHHAEPQTPARLARLLEAFWSLALLVCLALNIMGPALLALLTAPAYARAAPLLVWLAPAALMSQMYIFSPGIPLAQKTHWQLLLTLAAAALGLMLDLLLIPRFGAVGAAVAGCLAAALFFGAWLAAGQHLYPLPLRWLRLAGATLIFCWVSWALGAGALGGRPDESAAWSWALRLALLLACAAGLWAAGLLRPPRTADPIVAEQS